MCRRCQRGKCYELTAADALCIECPTCGGLGCDECGGAGEYEITGCPKRQVTPDVWDAVTAQEQSKCGTWPVSGGWMEQTQLCVDAVRIITSVRAELERPREE